MPSRFFETRKEAFAFKRKYGGAMYSSIPKSNTFKGYFEAASLSGFMLEDIITFPYVVAWSSVTPNRAGKIKLSKVG